MPASLPPIHFPSVSSRKKVLYDGEYFPSDPVERSMKQLWLAIGWLWISTLAGWPIGIVVINEPGIAPAPTPQPRPLPHRIALAPIEVRSVEARVEVRDQVASTVLEEEFYNPNARVCEGTFLFPVPKGAHLDRFALHINGQPVDAELLAADKARHIYEDIVRRSLDPGLLEYVGQDLYKLRIFPIEPNSRKQVTVSYTQVISEDAGLLNWTLPLRAEGGKQGQIAELKVRLQLQSKLPLKSIFSPSHKVDITRRGDHEATVTLEGKQVSLDSDFQLIYSRASAEMGLDLLTHRGPDGQGYFMLFATPQVESPAGTVAPKDVVFVLDASGSMAGRKLDQAKRALQFCVANLNDNDRFEVLRFSTEVEPAFQGLKEASASAREEALKFITGIRPTGGTAIYDALTQALALKKEDSKRSFVLVFLTDGRPTVGILDENEILKAIGPKIVGDREGLTRIFCFGIGTDVNTHLLDRITESTKAASTYVLPDEDIELKVSSFFSRIKEPALANIAFQFPTGVRVNGLSPNPLPDLFKGQQLVLVGRYEGSGSGAVTLSGQWNGAKREFSRDLSFPKEGSEYAFLPRLWATRRVGFLLDQIRLHGENAELRDEVVQLARQFAIVTPYTAYLVTEDEARRGVTDNRQTFQYRADAPSKAELRQQYLALTREKSGDSAVAGARSFSSLKAAESVNDAIALGGKEVARVAPASAAVASPTAPLPGVAVSTPIAQTKAVDPNPARFVGSKSFYRHGTQWVDGQVQSLQNPKKVVLPFASPAYFEFLIKNPEAKAWLSLGREVQVVVNGVLYEIVDAATSQP